MLMKFSTVCNGTQKGFVLPTCVACATISSDRRANPVRVIGFTERLGTGDPRVNIQNTKGMAKAYQVRQALKAIERLKRENEKN